MPSGNRSHLGRRAARYTRRGGRRSIGRCCDRSTVSDRVLCLRELNDADLAFALGDFELGDARFGHEVDQGFEFSKIHDDISVKFQIERREA